MGGGGEGGCTLILSPETKPLLISLDPQNLPDIQKGIYILVF